MTLFVSIVVSGLTVGAIYALVATGFSLVWATVRSTNFAHGDIYALGGYAAIGLVGATFAGRGHASVTSIVVVALLAALCGAVVGAVASMLIERTIFRPLRGAWNLAGPLCTLGVSIAIESALEIWVGSSYQGSALTFPTTSFELYNSPVSYAAIGVILVSVGLVLGVRWMLGGTRFGTSMRATAWDRETVGLMGVNTNTLAVVAFAIAGALAGFAGCVNTLYFGQITFYSGFSVTVAGFTAAVVGGYGSVSGALIGGLVLGLAQGFVGAVISSAWEQAITFILLAVVVLTRPTGLIGERLAVRV